MATKKTTQATEVTKMAFSAINFTNAFEVSNQQRYATREQADARAREMLTLNPASRVIVVQILADYETTLTITASEPAEVEDPAATGEQPA